MSTSRRAEAYIEIIPPTSDDYRKIRMAELSERTALIGRLAAASRELPPMATGDPPMHPVARAMIAVADEAMAHYVLSNMHPDDPRFPDAAAVEEKARADAREAVRVAIAVVQL